MSTAKVLLYSLSVLITVISATKNGFLNSFITFDPNSGYDNLLVKIGNDVPQTPQSNCVQILNELRV